MSWHEVEIRAQCSFCDGSELKACTSVLPSVVAVVLPPVHISNLEANSVVFGLLRVLWSVDVRSCSFVPAVSASENMLDTVSRFAVRWCL